jgi:hypothetical protein
MIYGTCWFLMVDWAAIVSRTRILAWINAILRLSSPQRRVNSAYEANSCLCWLPITHIICKPTTTTPCSLNLCSHRELAHTDQGNPESNACYFCFSVRFEVGENPDHRLCFSLANPEGYDPNQLSEHHTKQNNPQAEYPAVSVRPTFSRLLPNTLLGFLCDCCYWPRQYTLFPLS